MLSNESELSPALRYRILNTLIFLKDERKIHLNKLCLYSDKTMGLLGGVNQITKVLYVIKDILRFLFKLRKLEQGSYDAVIVKSNIFPIGGVVIEKWCIKNIRTQHWIYDIDDAIYLNTTRKENKVFSRFRDLKSKVGFWLSRASYVMISNDVIYDDLEDFYHLDRKKCTFFLSAPYRNQYFSPNESMIGVKELYRFIWLGSPHTQHELEVLDKFVHEIPQYIPEALIVLIGTNSVFNMYRGLSWVKFVEWTPESEVNEMRKASFGLNPLFDGAFERRKSAFKVVQYYRAGIIPLVSDVGINRKLVQKYGGYCTKDFRDLKPLLDYVKRKSTNIDFERSQLIKKTESLNVEENARLIEKLL